MVFSWTMKATTRRTIFSSSVSTLCADPSSLWVQILQSLRTLLQLPCPPFEKRKFNGRSNRSTQITYNRSRITFKRWSRLLFKGRRNEVDWSMEDELQPPAGKVLGGWPAMPWRPQRDTTISDLRPQTINSLATTKGCLGGSKDWGR